MAIIRCYECGKEISDAASTCPHCGAHLKEDLTETLICPYCKTKNNKDATVCKACHKEILKYAVAGETLKATGSVIGGCGCLLMIIGVIIIVIMIFVFRK